MYDIIFGAASESVWLKGGAGIRFLREYSTVVLPAANVLTLDAFNYEMGQTLFQTAALSNMTVGGIAMAAGTGGNVSDLYTSLRHAGQVNETMIATHLRIKVLRTVKDATTVANDVVVANAVYDQLVARAVIDLYHQNEKGPDVTGFIEEFPAGEGGDFFATAGALQYAKNGPPHISSARPLARPMLFLSGQDKKGSQYAGSGPTTLRLAFRFAENHGGVTLPTLGALMVYLDGYAVV